MVSVAVEEAAAMMMLVPIELVACTNTRSVDCTPVAPVHAAYTDDEAVTEVETRLQKPTAMLLTAVPPPTENVAGDGMVTEPAVEMVVVADPPKYAL